MSVCIIPDWIHSEKAITPVIAARVCFDHYYYDNVDKNNSFHPRNDCIGLCSTSRIWSDHFNRIAVIDDSGDQNTQVNSGEVNQNAENEAEIECEAKKKCEIKDNEVVAALFQNAVLDQSNYHEDNDVNVIDQDVGLIDIALDLGGLIG
jgi:hypothetical protein